MAKLDGKFEISVQELFSSGNSFLRSIAIFYDLAQMALVFLQIGDAARSQRHGTSELLEEATPTEYWQLTLIVSAATREHSKPQIWLGSI